MLQIRPITRAHTDAWLQMRGDLWPDDVEAHGRDVARFFSGDRREPMEVLIAFDGDAPVGFAELSIRNIVNACRTSNVGYLEGWYVVPAARRGGVGRRLMAAAEQWARQQGCTEFGSDVSLNNEPSAIAHRALGFEETGRGYMFRKDLR